MTGPARTMATSTRGDRVVVTLARLDDASPATSPVPRHVAVIGAWVRNFLSQPREDLGRAGPVCPFARPALDRNSLWIATIDGVAPDYDQVVEAIRTVLADFPKLPNGGRPDSSLNAVVVAFPEITDYAFIDRVQRALKPDFVSAGLMIGQFYPGCREPGLWNRDFRPLESPVPLIAVRHMVSNDFPFLSSEPSWIEAYLRRFAPAMPAQVRSTLARGFGDVDLIAPRAVSAEPRDR